MAVPNAMIANICVTYRLIVAGSGHNQPLHAHPKHHDLLLVAIQRSVLFRHNETVGGALPTVKQKTVDIVLPTAWNQYMMR